MTCLMVALYVLHVLGSDNQKRNSKTDSAIARALPVPAADIIKRFRWSFFPSVQAQTQFEKLAADLIVFANLLTP
jgi:hypothetical protein